jgi:hypothetical protein
MAATIYRVLVSENQKLYPNRVFVDIAPAQVGIDFYSTHAVMLQVRRKYNPDVDALTDGLLMYDFGNNEIRFKMEQVTDKRLKAYQEGIMARYREDILATYRQMKASGATSTLRTDTYSLAEIFQDIFAPKKDEEDQYPRSAREEAMREEARRLQDCQRRRQNMLADWHNRYIDDK